MDITEAIYYYKRANGDWVFSILDSHGIRRTIEKDERPGEQYLTMLRYAKKTPKRLYLDLMEDYRLIKRFFFEPAYWEGKAWQIEYTKP